jgi:hypothetical protein
MSKDLIRSSCSKPGRKRIGLFHIDELEVRPDMSQEKTESEWDCFHGLGLDASVNGEGGARDPGIDALSPACVPGLEYLEIQPRIHASKDLHSQGNDGKVVSNAE